MVSISEVSSDSFQVSVSVDDDKVTVVLKGTGDLTAVDAHKECLSQVRETMKDPKLTTVDVDIRSLYLLNSSCIKAFVHFIYLTQTQGPEFSVQFLVDKNISWQSRALAALCRMAPDLVSVKTPEKAPTHNGW